MGTKPILGCDVDLCVCPSDKGWLHWLTLESYKYFLRYGNEYTLKVEGEIPYNLGTLYPHLEDTYSYWRELDYSQFKHLNNSVESLEKLSQHFDIVFISSVKGNHWKSKVNWLKEHFPFSVGYMATKEKHLMNGSVVAMIDDRMSQLKGFDKEKRILFNTPYTQDVQCEVEMSFGVWNDEIVTKICSQYL